jgi:hypothetical protein
VEVGAEVPFATPPLNLLRKATGQSPPRNYSGPSLIELLLGRESQAKLEQSPIVKRKPALNGERCVDSIVHLKHCGVMAAGKIKPVLFP